MKNKPAEIFLFVGPTGAGKTTTVNMLGGQIPKSLVIDMDKYIAEEMKMSAQEYMGKNGKEAFFKTTLECIDKIIKKNQNSFHYILIDLGAGSTSDYNCHTLADKYQCVYLNASPKHLYDRGKPKLFFKTLEDFKFWHYSEHRKLLHDKCVIGIEVSYLEPHEVAWVVRSKITNFMQVKYAKEIEKEKARWKKLSPKKKKQELQSRHSKARRLREFGPVRRKIKTKK